MIMPEAEAKTKWCPWARISNDNFTMLPAAGAFNRVPGIIVPDDARCLGSGCMVWVQVTEKTGRCGNAR